MVFLGVTALFIVVTITNATEDAFYADLAQKPEVVNMCSLRYPEAHVVKSIRTLFYCAQRYGSTRAGAVVGATYAAGAETHRGAAALDGTLFVRVAGALTDALGWVAHGDQERSWDFRP
ncbi:hypothetical protein GGX14DRAFT_618263 [Mycena pura]|uniref:Uncharacterized protein n=1 Tax=Mycena pura TaxID=153505 RepID=A0AAD6YFH7_9AGAR|nr:hypothetical protein GGX14DRAFT_618263 [Mycena pura]